MKREIFEVRESMNLKAASLSPPDRQCFVKPMLTVWDSSISLSETTGDLSLAGAIADKEKPDILIIEARCDVPSDIAVLEPVTARHPGMTVILLCDHPTTDLMREAMRIGIRELLPLPLQEPMMLEALDRVRQRMHLASAPRSQGKVCSWVACKGGSGATFLASNFAYALAEHGKKRVAVIDLNLQFGDVSLFLSDQRPPSTLADVVKHIHRLDGAFLIGSMLQVTPNLHVLAAPESVEDAALVKPEHLDTLISVASSHYDYIVLDVGRNLDALSLRALDRSEMIFMVIQLTLPFIRDCKRMAQVMSSLGYGSDKLKLVINRLEKGGDISVANAESALGMKVYRTIPNSYSAVAASVNQGVPVIKLAPRDPVSKALEDMAHELAPVDRAAARKGFFFRR
jgi:pilus assembly protein CpaE